MCCLKNEQYAYEELIKITPNVGAIVKTPDGKGKVTGVNLLKSIITVEFDKDDDKAFKDYNVSEVKIIKNTAIKVKPEEEKELKSLED